MHATEWPVIFDVKRLTLITRERQAPYEAGFSPGEDSASCC